MPRRDRKKGNGGRTSDYACQYRVVDSPVHRLGGGTKLAIGCVLTTAAVAARRPAELAAVLLCALCYYFAACLSLYDLWRDVRYLLLQGVLITGLYLCRFGAAGTWPALRTSLQIILAFLPGSVFLRTTQPTALMRGLRRILPYQISFLVFTSLRFVPFFARETREIAVAQRMRGARLSIAEVKDPRNWPDLLHCLLLPLMVRALKTAEEASLSAQARGFGSSRVRSYWDPALLESPEGAGEKEPLPTVKPVPLNR
ncbi:energy-coupling factor transporter transmembrane protein EcfT [Geomonas sp. RF6]|uniref:energy-coupling factor transporter transmembrane component T family protein n=1 Tax=Geomonas sp. RF6 TaxID=2897342 RepID=UPI001E55624D|nr:energy-coupling factor transporter transmembrane component T [Geomonas sp. RF6]UFS70978.1 energy-coupling factor transporter transmembrane protein EcfT [Geomonas sp. RF6]